MTLQELIDEADGQGYRLVKKPLKTTLLACICGCRKRKHLYSNDGTITLVCMKCGKSVTGKSEMNARVNWNKEITRIMNEEFVRGERE